MVYARLCHLFSVSSNVLFIASSSFIIRISPPAVSPFKRIVLEVEELLKETNVLSFGLEAIPPKLFALAHQTRSI